MDYYLKSRDEISCDLNDKDKKWTIKSNPMGEKDFSHFNTLILNQTLWVKRGFPILIHSKWNYIFNKQQKVLPKSLGGNSSFLVEIMAIIHAASKAFSHGWNCIWLESDSTTVISCLTFL